MSILYFPLFYDCISIKIIISYFYRFELGYYIEQCSSITEKYYLMNQNVTLRADLPS